MITLNICETVLKEATVDRNPQRTKAAHGHIIAEPLRLTVDENHTYERIKTILHPNGALPGTNLNDVEILFTAKKYCAWLVTNDGGSRRQPGGILGNRKILANELGIIVMKEDEAVIEIRNRIFTRDKVATHLAEKGFGDLPDWVGKD